MVFTYHTIHLASKTDYNISKCTVIHIHTTFPYYLTWVNSKLVALLDMII